MSKEGGGLNRQYLRYRGKSQKLLYLVLVPSLTKMRKCALSGRETRARKTRIHQKFPGRVSGKSRKHNISRGLSDKIKCSSRKQKRPNQSKVSDEKFKKRIIREMLAVLGPPTEKTRIN